MEAKVEKIEQLNRMAELYFSLNQYATVLQMHINYNKQADMRGMFPKFRYCMIELYYLVRYNDVVRSDKPFTLAMNNWLKADLQKGVTVKYCRNSLTLFNKFIEKLVQLGVVEDLRS